MAARSPERNCKNNFQYQRNIILLLLLLLLLFCSLTAAASPEHCPIGGDAFRSAFQEINEKLYKILYFHGGDYEECRRLGYRNPVRTSQETHYVYITDSSRLMLSKILYFHGGDYEESRRQECYAVRLF
jgi:hypothetical protein